MDLDVRETSQLTGIIKVGEQIVGQANAVVSSETGTATSYNEQINNYPLYVEHKESCREQFDAFQIIVRNKEDDMLKAYHTPAETEEPEEVLEGTEDAPEEPKKDAEEPVE